MSSLCFKRYMSMIIISLDNNVLASGFIDHSNQAGTASDTAILRADPISFLVSAIVDKITIIAHDQARLIAV